MCILVTGGSGFIGSHFIRYALRRTTNTQVVNLDLLTYAGDNRRLKDVVDEFGSAPGSRYRFVHGDINHQNVVMSILKGELDGITRPDCIVHFAAESHVDRSILHPGDFVRTNVGGTVALLICTRAMLDSTGASIRFLHVSTDEVYGSLGEHEPAFTETTHLSPRSPYSASKASADMFVAAFGETYNLEALILRCSNNYGPFQFPEKLIPLTVTRALGDQVIPVYGDGLNIRDWLHVEDHASAVWRVLEAGEPSSVYNVGGNTEVANIDLVKQILQVLGKPQSLIRFVSDRPGHDRRYAMNISKITAALGWSPSVSLVDGLSDTVGWYVSQSDWWEPLLERAYEATNKLYVDTSAAP